MSYILDALRKADAQRERDPSRGIHAQLTPPLPLPTQADRPGRRLVWGAGLVALAGVLAWAGWSLGRTEAPPLAVPASAPAPAVVATQVRPETPPPAPAAELFPAAAPPAPAPGSAAREPGNAPQVVTAYPLTPAASAPGRVLSMTDLPADVQREMPKVNITGGVYSPNPPQRLLIVNGLVLNEGAEAAPGVRLEQIRPKLAVLVYRGYRYGVPY